MRPGSITSLLGLLVISNSITALPTAERLQTSIQPESKKEKYDLEPSSEFAFAGITTFAKFNSAQCLKEEGPVDDILVVGLPFDTATSYRSGTRFGPNAIRQASRAVSMM